MSISISDLSASSASGARPGPVSTKTSESCPHGLRPGTTVCLHCLRDKRLAARSRRYRLAMWIGLAIVASALAITLIVGAVASRKAGSPPAPPSATPAATRTTPVAKSRGTRQQPVPAIAPVRDAASDVARDATRDATSDATSGAVIAPVIAVGRTDLGDGVFVERTADSIVVHFDTDTLRTRFDWKFEGVVRATLPAVYPQARPALDAVPPASLAHGDLLNDLTRRGVRVELGAQGALIVWPLTRPGQDGPLVVAYRVTTAR